LSLALAISAILGAGMLVSACGMVAGAGPRRSGQHTRLATILTRWGVGPHVPDPSFMKC
jgi:hypothetical protein